MLPRKTSQDLPFYTIKYQIGLIQLVQRIYNQPVIYLPQYYNDDMVQAYHHVICANRLPQKESHIFILYGESGTGKTKFVDWLLFGIRKNSQVIFLEVAQLYIPAIVRYIESALLAKRETILVLDVGSQNYNIVLQAFRTCENWAEQYLGTTVFFIHDCADQAFTTKSDWVENYRIHWLPAFTKLSPDKVERFFRRLSCWYEHKIALSHAELFKILQDSDVPTEKWK